MFGIGKDSKYDGGSDEGKTAVAPAYSNGDGDVDLGITHDNGDQLKRKLDNRQIQLIAIGGSIGTAVFVSIGGALARGGPGSLLLAYFGYSILIGFVNNCMAESKSCHDSQWIE